uniref:Uncharacterized protein n=1 Tax=Anguilla anguilla TaxID=7936 RepID=A0A0E9S235_ANGAN
MLLFNCAENGLPVETHLPLVNVHSRVLLSASRNWHGQDSVLDCRVQCSAEK